MTDTAPPTPDPSEPSALDGVPADPTVHGELVDPVDDGDERREAIEEPAKLMRIGSMIKGLLEEVRAADLDEAARIRLREIYETSLAELGSSLSDDLLDELKRVTSPFADSTEPPSDAELRIAQAQLVGWLEGLFHGIQASLFAQQMAARAQLEQLHRQLPSGVGGPAAAAGGPAGPGGLGEPGPGTYL